MNLKDRRLKAKLYTTLYEAVVQSPTYGDLEVIENDVLLKIDGVFRIIVIEFSGNVYIYNKLPDGYSIKISKDTIIIRNILGRKNKDDLLFNFSGDFFPKKATMLTYEGNKISLNVFDKNKLDEISKSKTNFEDNTILLLEESEFKNDLLRGRRKIQNDIDDNSIKGLYTDTPFPDGYSGYYNYHPKEKIYTTGKSLTNESKVINTSGFDFQTKTQNKKLKNIYNKINFNIVKTGIASKEYTQERKNEEVKPAEKMVRKEAGINQTNKRLSEKNRFDLENTYTRVSRKEDKY